MTDADHATRSFRSAFADFAPDNPILILTHHDADGLASGALFKRALDRLGRASRIRVLGRGENAWSEDLRPELTGQNLGGLIVADLGTRGGPLPTDAPAIVVDHHVPAGTPGNATLVSGFHEDPIPTTSLLAFRCLSALTDVDDMLWLAGVGLLGDLGDKAPFPEWVAARGRYGATALKELVSLVNAPRRAAAGDASSALALLLRAESPKDAISGAYPELAALQAAREEVKAALDAGKRVPPRVVGDIALISLDTPCQIHPLVAQTWRTRLKDKIVIAANHGYRPGWVHFAARSATGRNLIQFLRAVAPPSADENYGGGHEQAAGGALRSADWPAFLSAIGHQTVRS